MKFTMAYCPNCNRQTMQGNATVPRWKHISKSEYTEKVKVCAICGYYIYRRKVWREKAFNPADYDLEVK